MLLGINLKDHAFLSADTRVTDFVTGEVRDIVQKIEFLPKHGLIIATAGRISIASEILDAITNGFVKIPITIESFSEKFDKVLNNFLKKETAKKVMPHNLLSPVIMVFHEYNGERIRMHALYVKFKIDRKITFSIYGYEVKNGQYIAVGAIGEDQPIKIAYLPKDSLRHIDSNNHRKTTYYDYTLATDMIFKTAKKIARIVKLNPKTKLRHNPIGGKTISVKTFIDSDKNCKHIGIPGYKSIIDKDDQYQDVSTVTMLDISSNRFYLRDMRKEGKIITNVEYKGPGIDPVLRYDSCPTSTGKEDKYYIGLSGKTIRHNINLEFQCSVK